MVFGEIHSTDNNIFEVPDDIQEKFNKDVERLDATLVSYPMPVTTNMPPVLLALDGINHLSVEDFPLNLDRYTLHKMQGKVKARQDDSHSMNLNDVKQVLKEIYDPIAVLKDKNGEGLIVITTMKAKNDSTIIIPIHLGKTKGTYVFNDLATGFGKENFEKWLEKRVSNIVYYNKEKNLEFSTLPHYWLDLKTVGVAPNQALSNRVLNPGDIVKRYSNIAARKLKNTESYQEENQHINQMTIDKSHNSQTSIEQQLLWDFSSNHSDFDENHEIVINKQLGEMSMPSQENQSTNIAPENFYINCPYSESRQAKALGAKWNPEMKKWYVPKGMDLSPFERWFPKEDKQQETAQDNKVRREKNQHTAQPHLSDAVTYLRVNFDEKDQVKALGARWNPEIKKWYVPEGKDLTPFEQWLPRESALEQNNNIESSSKKNISDINQIIDRNTKRLLDVYSNDIRRFNQSIDKVVNGNYGRGYIPIGRTPDVLKILEVPDVKVRIKEQHLEKIMSSYLGIPEGKYNTPHNVTPETLRTIPNEIHNPIAVFKSSTRDNSYLLLTEQYEQKIDNGRNAPVVVIFNLNTAKNEIDIIDIGSIYGRSEGQLLKDFTENLLYVNTEKGQNFLATERLQLPWDFTLDNPNLPLNCKTEVDLSQYISIKDMQQESTLLDKSSDILGKPLVQEVDFWKVFYQRHDETQIYTDLRSQQPTYLAVNFDNKDEAKSLGARWDADNKSWFAPAGKESGELRRFLPEENEAVSQVSSGKSLLDFQQEATAIGLDMRDFNQMPGVWHRTSIIGKNPHEKDGAYKIFHNPDGTIGAMARNLAANQEVRWSNRSHEHNSRHTETPREVIHALELNRNIHVRCQIEAREQIAHHRAAEAASLYHVLPNAQGDEPYLLNKSMQYYEGIKRLDDGSLVIPLFGKNQEIQSLQVISPEGEKKLMTQGQKLGAYFSLAIEPQGLTQPTQPSHVVIAEGVATAEAALQIAQKIYGQNVLAVAAIDSGNLAHVAEKIQQLYPEAIKIIAADNDRATEDKTQKNPGLDAAKEIVDKLPYFTIKTPNIISGKNTDWNDVLKHHGIEAAVSMFDAQKQKENSQSTLDKPSNAQKISSKTSEKVESKEKKTIQESPDSMDKSKKESKTSRKTGNSAKRNKKDQSNER